MLQVGMNCRFRAQYVNVKERIDTELGELRFLRGTYVVNSVEAVRSGQKPWHREYPEGYVPFLYSGALHCLDLMRWIAGPIRAAWARAAAFELAQEWGLDTFSASLLFSGGAIGELTASASAFRPPDFKLEAWFANGSLVDGWEFRRAGEGLDPKGVQLAIDQPKIDVAMQFDDMLEAIETERAPLNSAREARENFRVLTAIHRSALDGGPVQVGEPTGPDHDPIGELYGDP